jgi:hypothetical protein
MCLANSSFFFFFFFLKKKKIIIIIILKGKLHLSSWSQGVAETTPNGGLGVVSATLLAPWGWLLGAQGGGRSHPKFCLFFFEFFF